MLVATYLRQQTSRSIWYNVDELDADTDLLFAHLKLGLIQLGESVDGLVPPGEDRSSAQRFFEEFWQRLGPDGLLVLDGCPEYSEASAAWYEVVLAAAHVSSARRNLLLLSRSGPPAICARLLAESRLSLIGWESLRLSHEEAQQLARQRAACSRVTLSEQQEQELLRHGQGWAVSIVLSVECARLGRHSRCSLLGASEVAAYFEQELWRQTHAELQQFALETAFLPELGSAWLKMLYPGRKGELLLQSLKAQHPFALELNAEGSVQKYSQHIRQFLLSYARGQWGPARVTEWQRRIGDQLAALGDLEAGLALLHEAAALDAVAAVLAKEAPRFLAADPPCPLATYLEKLPLELVQASPWLSLWSACLQLVSNPESAGKLAQRAFEAFDAEECPNGYWLAWRTLLASHSVDERGAARANELIQLALRALKHQAFNDDQLALSVCRGVAFAAINLMPDDPAVRQCAEQALTGPACASTEQLALAIFYLGFNGNLAQLDAVNVQWRAHAKRATPAPDARLWLALSELFHSLFSGDFSRAQQVAAAGFEQAERDGLTGETSTLLTMWGYSCLARGDAAQLTHVLQKMERIPGAERRLQLANYRFVSGLQALSCGERERARQFLEQAYLTAQRMEIPLAETLHGLGLCEALLALDATEEATALMERVVPRIPSNCVIVRQSAGLLHAAIAQRKGDLNGAKQRLKRALTIERGEQFLPVPLPTRASLTPLLQLAMDHGVHVGAARRIADAMHLHPLATFRSQAAPPSSSLPRKFVQDVRESLRRLHQTEQLLSSPLLDTTLFSRELALERRTVRLREILVSQVQQLANNAQTEPFYRALHHTFVQPSGTQLLAAECAAMSFGTYRRHLKAGIQEVAANLWILTRAAESVPSSRRDEGHRNATASTGYRLVPSPQNGALPTRGGEAPLTK
jgi:ATP/maltotriose-dependent transcriptional regulator MalT